MEERQSKTQKKQQKRSSQAAGCKYTIWKEKWTIASECHWEATTRQVSDMMNAAPGFRSVGAAVGGAGMAR